LRIRVDSECHHCSRPLIFDVDEELGWQVLVRVPHLYCLSPTFSGARFEALTSFRIIELRPYSSGQKNTPASTGTGILSRMERT